MEQLIDFFSRNLRTIPRPQFEPFVLVNRVEGQLALRISDLKKGEVQELPNVFLTTKWLYRVDKPEPASI
jgi:hypothetical protein